MKWLNLGTSCAKWLLPFTLPFVGLGSQKANIAKTALWEMATRHGPFVRRMDIGKRPGLREHPWIQPAVRAQHLVAMPTFRSESSDSNSQYNMSSSYTGAICPSLGQDMTSQVPASLVQNSSPSLIRRDHEIGDGSPALRIVRQLEVEAESWAVPHDIGVRSQNRGDSS